MSHGHLKLDRFKTELLTPCPNVLHSLYPLVVQPKQNPELILDSSLSLTPHIQSIRKYHCFLDYRNNFLTDFSASKFASLEFIPNIVGRRII